MNLATSHIPDGGPQERVPGMRGVDTFDHGPNGASERGQGLAGASLARPRGHCRTPNFRTGVHEATNTLEPHVACWRLGKIMEHQSRSLEHKYPLPFPTAPADETDAPKQRGLDAFNISSCANEAITKKPQAHLAVALSSNTFKDKACRVGGVQAPFSSQTVLHPG